MAIVLIVSVEFCSVNSRYNYDILLISLPHNFVNMIFLSILIPESYACTPYSDFQYFQQTELNNPH